MPSRAYTSFLHFGECSGLHIIFVGFNALSGLYLISTEMRFVGKFSSVVSFNALSGLSCYEEMVTRIKKVAGFNALSGLYLISTKPLGLPAPYQKWRFQCPLGLIPHFYILESAAVYTSSLSVSMPSRAYTSFLPNPLDIENGFRAAVSMPSRAYTSFLQYPFKNLGFMRFPEPVFAGIYQNILTTAVFRAC